MKVMNRNPLSAEENSVLCFAGGDQQSLYPHDLLNPVYLVKMEKEDITHKIIGAAYKVYNELGPPASPE